MIAAPHEVQNFGATVATAAMGVLTVATATGMLFVCWVEDTGTATGVFIRVTAATAMGLLFVCWVGYTGAFMCWVEAVARCPLLPDLSRRKTNTTAMAKCNSNPGSHDNNDPKQQ